MSDIDIKETLKDNNSPFNVKIFHLNGLGKDFLIKTIDTGNTKKAIIESKEKGDLKNKKVIFEKSKIIKDFESIKNLIDSDNKKDINNFFGRQAWLNDRYNIFHATLKFNPYKSIKKVEEMSGFLNYYYTYSKNIVFIPNVVKNYTPYDKEKKERSKERIEIINFEEYVKLVDELYVFFETMNNKPIFVPISLKFSIGDIKKLVDHYLKKERYYFWIDFEAFPIDEHISAVIREINNSLRNSEYFDKCLLFVTNIKREIISHSKSDKSPASDILGTLCGANLVGVDKNPPKGMNPPTDPEKLKLLREHKARVFDPKTYYYFKLKDKVISKEQNVTDNSILLSYEFDKQKENFLKNSEIKTYLGTKEMIKEHNKGKILKEFSLMNKDQKTLF